ncbi:hypothetical protein P3W33_15000 [Luteibacter sp. PPL552]
MRHGRLLVRIAALGLLVLTGGPATAASLQLVVITAPGAPRLAFDKDVLRNVYLKRIFVDADGVKLTPVNLPAGSPLREAFARTIVRMSDERMQAYWDQQYFQGVSPPYVLGSEDAVVRFVATTPGAVGYVASCHVDASVHVVLALPWPLTGGAPDPCAGHAAP